MKVKIGDTFFDSGEQPIMLVLSRAERTEIEELPQDHSLYCGYPPDMDRHRIEAWMQGEICHDQITVSESVSDDVSDGD